MKDETKEAIERAMEEAESEDSLSAFTLEFASPFEYEGKKYDKFTFDWGKLTGDDFMKIEKELAVKGTFVVIPDMQTEFLLEMAVRACDAPIDALAIKKLPLVSFNKVRSRARNFLLHSEQ